MILANLFSALITESEPTSESDSSTTIFDSQIIVIPINDLSYTSYNIFAYLSLAFEPASYFASSFRENPLLHLCTTADPAPPPPPPAATPFTKTTSSTTSALDDLCSISEGLIPSAIVKSKAPFFHHLNFPISFCDCGATPAAISFCDCGATPAAIVDSFCDWKALVLLASETHAAQEWIVDCDQDEVDPEAQEETNGDDLGTNEAGEDSYVMRTVQIHNKIHTSVQFRFTLKSEDEYCQKTSKTNIPYLRHLKLISLALLFKRHRTISILFQNQKSTAVSLQRGDDIESISILISCFQSSSATGRNFNQKATNNFNQAVFLIFLGSHIPQEGLLESTQSTGKRNHIS
ncbi:hypothetical protein LXL04_023018 [Taraxacum kok-saghyz]